MTPEEKWRRRRDKEKKFEKRDEIVSCLSKGRKRHLSPIKRCGTKKERKRERMKKKEK